MAKRKAAAAGTGVPASSSGATHLGSAAGIREGRVRAVIDAVLRAVDGGRFPIKCSAGEAVAIEAHCFTDGHDKLRVLLRWGAAGASEEYEVEMKPQGNDVWQAELTPPRAGRYRYTVWAWVDPFESWRHELERRDDRADIRAALQVGAALIDEAAARASGGDAAMLAEWSAQMRALGADAGAEPSAQKALALDAARAAIVARHADRSRAVTAAFEL